MTTRRSVLKGITLGAGSLALSPFLNRFAMLDAKEEDKRLPKRFVFIVKARSVPVGRSPVGANDSNHDSCGLPRLFKSTLVIHTGLYGVNVEEDSIWPVLLSQTVCQTACFSA